MLMPRWQVLRRQQVLLPDSVMFASRGTLMALEEFSNSPSSAAPRERSAYRARVKRKPLPAAIAPSRPFQKPAGQYAAIVRNLVAPRPGRARTFSTLACCGSRSDLLSMAQRLGLTGLPG